MGKLVRVRITKSTKFSMLGEIIDEETVQSPTDICPLKKGEVSGSNQANGGNSKKRKKVSTEASDFMQNFMYKSSMLILLMAILIRVFQLIYYATIKKESDDPQTSPLEGVTTTQFSNRDTQNVKYM